MTMPKDIENQKEFMIEELKRIIRYNDKDLCGFARKIGISREYIYMIFNGKSPFLIDKVVDYYEVYDYVLKVELFKEGDSVYNFCYKDKKTMKDEMVHDLKRIILDKEGKLLNFGKRLGYKGYYMHVLFSGRKKFTYERLFNYLAMYGYYPKISFIKLNETINKDVVAG